MGSNNKGPSNPQLPSCSWNSGGSSFLGQSRGPTPRHLGGWDQLDVFQNKIISVTETGFSSRFFHMLKFLSPSSLAAAIQGIQLYRATGSTSAYLWQKADEKSCEPTNHNLLVIKHLETEHDTERWRNESSAACCRVPQQSGTAYRNSNHKQIPTPVWLCPRLSAPSSTP